MSESANLSRTGQRWWADWAAEHSERRLVMKQKVSAHSTVMPWKVQEMQRWTWGLHYSRIYNGCSGVQEHHYAAGMASPSGFSLNTTAVVFCITGNILQYHIKSVGQCMLCSLELVWLVLMHGIVPWGEVLVGRLESHHGRAKLISLGMRLLSGAPLRILAQTGISGGSCRVNVDSHGKWNNIQRQVTSGRPLAPSGELLVYNRKGQSFCVKDPQFVSVCVSGFVSS